MIHRRGRWLVLLVLLALLVPAPVPVAAQTAPTIFLNPDYGRAGSSGTWSIQVSGSGWYNCPGTIFFDGAAVANFAGSGGNFGPVTITVSRRVPGAYSVNAHQNDCTFTRAPGPPRTASTTFWSMDATATDEGTGRDCAPAGAAWVLRVEARGWEPGERAYVEFRRNGTTVAERGRILVEKDGTFVARLNISAQSEGATYTIYMYDLREREITLPWTIPCPIRPTTSTTSVTTPDITTTTTTAPAADVTLAVEPALGPPGFVAQVRGTGYPPGPVVVRWDGGMGQVTATVADDGTFSTPLLVFPNDRLGPRAVVATAGATERFAPFLVVPGTVKPSGRDVTQITRARRHLQR